MTNPESRPHVEMPRQSFIAAPINLHETLTLTNDDIEGDFPQSEWSTGTLAWKTKFGFPTYHLDVNARTLIVMDIENSNIFGFRLKEDSPLLAGYINRYESKKTS